MQTKSLRTSVLDQEFIPYRFSAKQRTGLYKEHPADLEEAL